MTKSEKGSSWGSRPVSRREALTAIAAGTAAGSVFILAFPTLRSLMQQDSPSEDPPTTEQLRERTQEFLAGEYARFVQENGRKFNLERTFLFVPRISESPPQVVIEICRSRESSETSDEPTPVIALFVMEIPRGTTYDYERDLKPLLLRELRSFGREV